MARVTLFDQTQLSPTSPLFYLHEQVTVVAQGLQPDDIITFEVVKINPAARAQACGCDYKPPGMISLNSVQQLLCPACDSDPNQRPVRLTARNPVVVLDSPQGYMIRAVFDGDGLETGEVSVYAMDTNTQGLTDAMRGCGPVCCEDEEEVWDVTGIHRCTDTTVQVQERSNCGNQRWVDCGDVVWIDTGKLRCVPGSETATEIEQTNQCGHRRWVAGPAQEWVATGKLRCVPGSETETEIEQTNQCGHRRWVAGPAQEWVATGITQCIDNLLVVQETNQCGLLRWVETDRDCIGGLLDCEGEPHAVGAQVPTCQQMQDAIDEAISEVEFTVEPTSAATSTEQAELPTTVFGSRSAVLGQPSGWINVGGYRVPHYGEV